MRIEFTVRLPVDSQSVPLVRTMCRTALEHLRVDKDVVVEVALALTEACANVVHHAGEHDDYEVHVCIDDEVCEITVSDQGDGFDLPDPLPAPDPAAGAGHGLLLMRALVDDLHFARSTDGRHQVTLAKRLRAAPPLRLVAPV